jgi:hypothetical protein
MDTTGLPARRQFPRRESRHSIPRSRPDARERPSHRRFDVGATKGMAHSRTNQLVDLLVIGKPDLSFSRMHVDIDPLGLDIKKEHKQRSMALREKRTVAIHNRMLHGAVFDRPAIDEEFLRRPPGARARTGSMMKPLRDKPFC